MKKNIKYFFACILIFNFYTFTAQETKKTENNRAIDSLLSVLKTVGEDTTQVNNLNNLSVKYLNISDYEQALKYARQAQQHALNISYKKGISNSYCTMGHIYFNQGNYPKALDNYLNSLIIQKETNDKQGLAESYNNIGVVYWNQGNYEKTLENYLNSLKTEEEIGNKRGIANSYNNIGTVYLNQENYEKALEIFFKSLKIQEEIHDEHGASSSYNNIGLIYSYQKNFTRTLEYYSKSLEIKKKLGDNQGIANVYNNIGILYYYKKNYHKTLENFLKSLRIREEIGDKPGTVNSYINIANVCVIQGKFEESNNYLSKSLLLSKKIGYKEGIEEAYSTLSDLFEKKGDFKQAYEYHKLYSDIKDTLLNVESSKQIAEMNTKYESEKKEKDILLLTKDKNLQQAEIGKQKFIRNGTIGGLVLALSLAFILFNRFRVTSKQKKIIESQNFQIVESINYSKKIQDSLLPSIENMQKAIPNIFVFYEPKAIVSGDFYYFKQFEKYTLLACVDCTGHGVPGGFMSTLGSLLLDKIADDETVSPSEILNKLSDEIIRVLHQQDGGEIQDGMDLSICLIDRNNKKIEYSGARNGIIVVTNEQAKRYKADPLPVGGNYMKKGIAIERNFKTQHIPINVNDWIYMYTDGFMEQVGGAEGIPMNYSQFENQLINVSKIESPEEKNKLLQLELDNWRGTLERDDDVLIMGFRVV